jgi:CheY-like chemotaxis protein
LANILIVEDEREIAEGLAELLSEAGHGTRIAPDGVQGLRRIAEGVPDLILLDVEMPILDGPGMARALATERSGRPPIPIVVVSASPHIRRLAERIGTPHFVKKPFSLDRLIEVVNQALASSRP